MEESLVPLKHSQTHLLHSKFFGASKKTFINNSVKTVFL